MTSSLPHDPRRPPLRLLRSAGAWLLAAFLAHLLDHWVWTWITMGPGVEKRDWWQFLRAQGYLPTWIVLALAIELVNRGVSPISRRPGLPGLGVLLSAAASGALAEVLKLILARDRPGPEGLHVWHGFFGGFAAHPGPGLGLPSSHAAVAFGGAFALARAFPAVACLAIALACGCGVSRMLAGAHFFSDTVLAAGLGWSAAALLVPRAPRSRP